MAERDWLCVVVYGFGRDVEEKTRNPGFWREVNIRKLLRRIQAVIVHCATRNQFSFRLYMHRISKVQMHEHYGKPKETTNTKKSKSSENVVSLS